MFLVCRCIGVFFKFIFVKEYNKYENLVIDLGVIISNLVRFYDLYGIV